VRSSPFEEIIRPKLLIGEGQDEVRFFGPLLRHLGRFDIQVTDYSGKAKLKTFLATLPRIPGFANLEMLAITVDADDDANAAAGSIQQAIADANLPAGLQHSVHVLPDTKSPGALETLCLDAVLGKHSRTCLELYLNCCHERGLLPEWSVGNAAKARMQSWLAIQERPGLRLGEAAEAGLIPWDAEPLQQICQFLCAL
jgi:hypothetical protein